MYSPKNSYFQKAVCLLLREITFYLQLQKYLLRENSSHHREQQCVGQKQFWALPSEAVTGRYANSRPLLASTHWATEGQKELQEHIFWERGMSSHQVYEPFQRSPPRLYELTISYRKNITFQLMHHRVQLLRKRKKKTLRPVISLYL